MLAGKVAIVTGSTRGIGLAIAMKFHDAGACVVFNGRAAKPDAGFAGCFSGKRRWTYFGADLTEEGACQAIVDHATSAFGNRLDVLVNNAAIQRFGGIGQLDAQDWSYSCQSNILVAASMVKAAFAAMKRTGAASIINIASSRAVRPGSGMAAYSASKAALVSLTQSAAVEFGSSGIRVNAISPGLIERPGIREDWPQGVSAFEHDAPLGRIGKPNDIGEVCLFLASSASEWITGINMPVDGGITLVR